jgi:multidrug efflux pump
MMRSIIDFGLRQNRAILSMLVLIFIAGISTYIKIPKESFPDIKIPIMIVQLTHDGIAPEDAERLLIRPMEKQLRTLENLKDYKSTAFEGGANITLEFNAGFNAKEAKDAVRDKVDLAKADLPADTREPNIIEINTSKFPVLTVKLSGAVPQRTLIELGRTLKDAFEANVSEVLEVNMLGDRVEQVEIQIDPIKLETYAVDLLQVIQQFSANNIMVNSGSLETGKGRFPVKVPGLINDVKDLFDFPVMMNGQQVVTFKDIANVKLVYQDAESYARDHGHPAVALEVTKRTGENIIETVEKVKHVLSMAKASDQWPNNVQVGFSQDQTKQIEDFLFTLQNTLIFTLMLVIGIIVYSMGVRPSVLVGLSVPGSFLIGLLLLNAMGYTMNMIVLFSFILAAGMLVDGAIIVVEYADRRMIEGVDRVTAYKDAAHKMLIPILTSVGTIGIVFMPLLFWPGIVGEFMKFMPITLIFTLSGSIIMAVFFTPILGAMTAKVDMAHYEKTKDDIIAAQNCKFNEIKGFTGKYVMVLERQLHHPWRLISTGIAALVVVQIFYSFLNNGLVFFPDTDAEQAQINIRARGDMSGLEKDALVWQVESLILDMKELKSIYARTDAIKGGTKGAMDRGSPPDTIGTIFLEFSDWNTRRRVNDILKEIKQRCSGIPGVILDVSVKKSGPPSDKPIDIGLTGSSLDSLAKAADSLKEKLISLGGAQDIEDSRFLPGVQLNVNVDRVQAAKYGATIQSVGGVLRMLTTGLKVGSYRTESKRDELDVLLRFNPAYKNFDEIAHLRLPSPLGSVAISQFATQSFSQKVGTIRRLNGSRIISVKANVAEGHLASEKVAAINKWIKDSAPFSKDVSVVFRGEDKDQKETGAFLGKAFMWAILLMLFILILQFNSFFSAFLVLSAIVMSTVGVFIGLMIHQIPFSVVMGGVSIIALAGIIVSNNIILIDTFDETIKTIKDVRTAILYTCAQRLRPIVLTHITVILGLLPIVFLINFDFVNFTITVGDPAMEFWQQLAICICYGVAFGSLLTSFVTPAALMARHNFQEKRRLSKLARA